MIAYLAADTATSSVPLAGWAIDALFPGHLMAANALQKDIEARHGPSDLPGWGGRKPSKGARGGTEPARVGLRMARKPSCA